MSIVPLYYITIKQIITGIPVGDKPMSTTGLIVTDLLVTLIVGGSVLMVFFLKLKTVITSEGIFVQFNPFVNGRLIRPHEIEHWEVRKYNPVKEYGGWGYRFGSGKKGAAYNVKGNLGLQLVLNGNKRLLIGTQRPDAIKRAMEKLMYRTNE
jgi:hypothetical protein